MWCTNIERVVLSHCRFAFTRNDSGLYFVLFLIASNLLELILASAFYKYLQLGKPDYLADKNLLQ